MGTARGLRATRLAVGGHNEVDFECSNYQFRFRPKLLVSSTAEWLERWSPTQEVPVRFPEGASCVGPERFHDSSSLLESAFHGVADTR